MEKISHTPESSAQIHYLKLPRLQIEALKIKSQTLGKPPTVIMSGFVEKFLRIVESCHQDSAKNYINFVQNDATKVREELRKKDPAWMGKGMCFRELLFLPSALDSSLKKAAQTQNLDPTSLVEDIVVRSLHHPL